MGKTDNTQSVFRRGVLSMVILSLLKQADMYGYQIVQEAVRQSSGAVDTQEGSLYPVLYKLQELGLISDRKVLSGKRMVRVYYHLEPAGEVRLAELIRAYEEMHRGVTQIIYGGVENAAKGERGVVSTAGEAGTALPVEKQTPPDAENSGTGGQLSGGPAGSWLSESG